MTQPAPLPVNAVTVSLQQLVDQFGAEAVMTANNGQIPATQEELNNVALALGVA